MIKVKLFAMLKERAGRGELNLPFEGGSAADLIRQVNSAYPGLAEFLDSGRVMISVNQEFVKPEALLKDGDEVALMPPFSGGGNRTGHVRIQKEPFLIDEEVENLKRASNAIGGIAVFVGTTRDISKGKSVSKLEFEHYPGMAEKKLAEIRERAIRDFGLIDAVIVHRIGTVPVGENIVLIAAAAVHRDEAFKACRF